MTMSIAFDYTMAEAVWRIMCGLYTFRQNIKNRTNGRRVFESVFFKFVKDNE